MAKKAPGQEEAEKNLMADIFTQPKADAPVASDPPPAADPAPVTEPVVETTPEPVTPPSWIDSLKTDFGFSDIKDEDDARQRVLQALRQEKEELDRMRQEREQYRPLVQYGQQYIDELQKRQAEQAKPATPEPAKPDNSPWPNVRAVDPKVVERYYNAETKQWNYATPPSVIQEVEEAMTNTQKWTNDLVYKPREALEPIIDYVVTNKVQKILEEQFGMKPQELVQQLDISGERKYVNDVLVQYEDVLFERDPRTSALNYDRPSQIGQKFSEALQEAENILKIPTEAGRYYYAAKQIQPFISQQTRETAASTVAQTADQKRSEHLHRAAARSVPSRDGSVSKNPDAPGRQNPNVRSAQAFAEAFFAEGVNQP